MKCILKSQKPPCGGSVNLIVPLNPPAFGMPVALGNSPLRNVICQLRFPPILSIGRSEYIARFQEEIRELYPILSQIQGASIQVAPGESSPVQLTSGWQFADPIGWTVTLTSEWLGLETSAYSTFSDFSQRFDQLVRLSIATFAPARRDRIGLRYINEIEHPEPDGNTPASWRPWLREELLGVVGGDVVGEDVIQSLQQIRVEQPDGVFVLTHGFVRSQQGDSSAASKYLLDFDYFNEDPEPLDPDALHDQLAHYNDLIYRVFRWSIQEKLFQFLRASPKPTP